VERKEEALKGKKGLRAGGGSEKKKPGDAGRAKVEAGIAKEPKRDKRGKEDSKKSIQHSGTAKKEKKAAHPTGIQTRGEGFRSASTLRAMGGRTLVERENGTLS